MDETFTNFLREGIYAEASPVTHVTSDDAALFLIHGTGDPIVPTEQLPIMKNAAKDAGLSVEATVIESDSHSPPIDHAAIVTWFEKQLL
jgi:dipeptidyl aminopeptidase/acylaminoacyl peptidase